MFRILILTTWLTVWGSGCGRHIHSLRLGVPFPTEMESAILSNPLNVPPVDPDFLWNQIVDSIDDFFRIERERRLQRVGNILTDGRLDTFPTIGSTLLEPWRKDSNSGYETAHATLQTIRRQAVITVAPDSNGYFIQVTVVKDLEAVNHPEHASVGTSTLRHDNTLVSRDKGRGKIDDAKTLGWIRLGRDTQLEQQILLDIRARVADFQP